MSTRTFRAVALTPIHVGTGEALAPEDYFTQRRELVRFNLPLVLGRMTVQERAQHEAMLDSGKYLEALTLLRERARQDQGCWMYRVPMGENAQRGLEGVVSEPEKRRGEVRALPRNPLTGDVVIPGSAIKGAIRTAVLNGFVQWRSHQDPLFAEKWKSRVERAEGRELGRLWKELEGEVFGMADGGMEHDPFRMVRVSDAVAAAEQVSVDRVWVERRNASEEGQQGIQMYAERLKSMADGVKEVGFEVSISVDEEKVKHPKVQALFRDGLNWTWIGQQCDGFFRGRFNAEAASFPSFYLSTVFSPEAMSVLGQGHLIRIGRFSHFESLSVDGLRRGENRFTKRPIYGMGGSRTVCEVTRGVKAPFGWLVLLPEK